MTTITILDYGIGNVLSIYNAVEKVGNKAIITNDKKVIRESWWAHHSWCRSLAHGMLSLDRCDLVNFTKDVAQSGKPVLGICLGMQMLFLEVTSLVYTKVN